MRTALASIFDGEVPPELLDIASRLADLTQAEVEAFVERNLELALTAEPGVPPSR
ncbi:MAG: hypothetical protein OEV40_23405 [Acidimicrobiia bacterium]|nr:hypothetical protein [Acidimicrobiia bacterium]